jgi:hypothetical protein
MRVELTEVYRHGIKSLEDRGDARDFVCSGAAGAAGVLAAFGLWTDSFLLVA